MTIVGCYTTANPDGTTSIKITSPVTPSLLRCSGATPLMSLYLRPSSDWGLGVCVATRSPSVEPLSSSSSRSVSASIHPSLKR